MTSTPNLCPCFSGKEYEQCCQPFHEGRIPENALDLMRSRYAAYVYNLPNYIIETTHPASPQYTNNKFLWKKNISHFAKHSDFQKLEILDFKERNTLATVSFTAYLSQEGQDATFTEKSYFEKIKGRWFYRGGQLAQGHAPNLVTTGQFRLLPFAYYGDPILRRKADEIMEITDDTKKLIEEMIETMDASEGIGLAAPQIHHSVRIFVIRAPIQIDENNYEAGEAKVFINPVLSNFSNEKSKINEGCLSIPTVRLIVERPKELTIKYMTIEGENVEERLDGWEARIVQHEYDHIEGILFIDRVSKEELNKWIPFLQDFEQRIHDGRAF